MGLTMKERKKAAVIIAPRYQKARKKEKGTILNEFIELTGYGRRYASYILRSHGKKVCVRDKEVIIGDVRKRMPPKRPRMYDDAVLEALKKVWYIMDCICGKRLAPVLQEVVGRLVRCREIRVDPVVRKKLGQMSAATIDRLLAKEGRKQTIKGRSNTKPGTLLKHQIPIRTFSDWNEQRPGFMEIDLVGHDGGDAHGEFAQTLDVTDVCTTWTETAAVRNKAQKWVFEALMDIRQRLPFDLLGIDSDSGSEFINDICTDTVDKRVSPSPGPGAIEKMTIALSSRRITRSYEGLWDTSAMTRKKNGSSLMSCTGTSGSTPTSFNPR